MCTEEEGGKRVEWLKGLRLCASLTCEACDNWTFVAFRYLHTGYT